MSIKSTTNLRVPVSSIIPCQLFSFEIEQELPLNKILLLQSEYGMFCRLSTGLSSLQSLYVIATYGNSHFVILNIIVPRKAEQACCKS